MRFDIVGVVRKDDVTGWLEAAMSSCAKGSVTQHPVVFTVAPTGDPNVSVIKQSRYQLDGVSCNRHKRHSIDVRSRISLLVGEPQVTFMFLPSQYVRQHDRRPTYDYTFLCLLTVVLEKRCKAV